MGLLKRIPNTVILCDRDGNQIGATIDDAIAYLNSDKGRIFKNQLMTQVKVANK